MHSNQEPIQSYEIDPSKDLDPNIKHYKFEYLLNNTVIVDTFLNVESCSDGIKNRDELFIDCGGDCNVECFDFLSLENSNFIYISEINTEDSKISGYFKCHFILEYSLDDGKNVTPIVIKEDSVEGTFINLKYH